MQSTYRNKMIEVFKTNVERKDAAKELLTILLRSVPNATMNFDLEDCDKILRVDGNSFNPGEIIQIVNKSGYHCETLK